MSLNPKVLWKAALSDDLVLSPSPGSLQSSRLAARVTDDAACHVYFASGARLYQTQVSIGGEMMSKGKGNLLIPALTTVKATSLLGHSSHLAEIQSVALSDGSKNGHFLMGAVDSFGHAIISSLEFNYEGEAIETYKVSPKDSGVGEGGWAGIKFGPSRIYLAAVARSICRTIDLYDKDIHLRSLHTLLQPTAICFCSIPFSSNESSNILAISEESQLSIWDIRTNHNGGCVQRLSVSSGETLYSVSCSPCGFIGASGADRCVTIFDPRRWSTVSKWTSCLKYGITGSIFSNVQGDFLYVHGLDTEVVCGKWKPHPKHEFSFRGDSRWLGFNIAVQCTSYPNMDTLVGWSESQSVFVTCIEASDLAI